MASLHQRQMLHPVCACVRNACPLAITIAVHAQHCHQQMIEGFQSMLCLCLIALRQHSHCSKHARRILRTTRHHACTANMVVVQSQYSFNACGCLSSNSHVAISTLRKCCKTHLDSGPEGILPNRHRYQRRCLEDCDLQHCVPDTFASFALTYAGGYRCGRPPTHHSSCHGHRS